jgi:hypothetical protein
VDTLGYLGSHSFGGGGATTRPGVQRLGGQSATVGQAGSFTVSATGIPPDPGVAGHDGFGRLCLHAGTGQLSYTPPEADLGERTFTFTPATSPAWRRRRSA